MLRKLDLNYVIKDEGLLITTPEEASNYLTTTVYPVEDLVLYHEEDDGTDADFDSLVDLMTSTVDPQSWDGVGGPGSVRELPINLTLVISQTQENHRQIEQLLQNLRRTGRKKTTDGKPPIRRRPKPIERRRVGGMGGAGMGGGAAFGGGLRGGDVNPSGGGGIGGQPPADTSVIPAAEPGAPAGQRASPDGMNGLLQGLQEANEAFQGKQVDQLQQIYKRGQGMGMGGMGGGFGGGVEAGEAF